MRTLGIDYGHKRVGLALSDAGGTLASPLGMLDRSNDPALVRELLKVFEKEGVERVVLGLPLNMDGSLSPMARQVMMVGAQLQAQAKVELIYVDERLSSFEAEQWLIERKRAGEKMTRGDKKKQLDALAACGFLQAFLDGKLAPIILNHE
jgi:putative holliday junction resolvase